MLAVARSASSSTGLAIFWSLMQYWDYNVFRPAAKLKHCWTLRSFFERKLTDEKEKESN